jgi:hypothetical protein
MPSPRLNWIQITSEQLRDDEARWQMRDRDTQWEIRRRPWYEPAWPGYHDIFRDGTLVGARAMLYAAKEFVANEAKKREAV